MTDEPRYEHTEVFDPRKLYELFQATKWIFFLDMDEVACHIEISLYIVTTWIGEDLIGYGRLDGDGKIDVSISDLVVREDHRGKGIGTAIVNRLVEQTRRLDPYYIQVSPIDDRSRQVYEKFGFTVIPDYVRMELDTPKLRRKLSQRRDRSRC